MWQLPKMSPSNILKYLRKSRTDDPLLTVEEVLSKHEQMLDEWIARNFPGMPGIPECNCYREVVSGETIESRPKVQELLRQIESPVYKAVLIVEPQRLSRGDLEDIGRLVKLFRYTNTLVITLNYIYDLNDQRDRDDFERELKRGNEFLEYQKRIMGNGRLLAVQNGSFIGQRPPYGYRKKTIKEGKRTVHTLEPDPETAPIVKMIFQKYADGDSAVQIARTLNNMGVLTALGAPWKVSSVRRILQNEHYIGNVCWYRRKTVMSVEDGEIIVSHPLNKDYISCPGKHEAIIDQDLWDAVQDICHYHLPVKARAQIINPFAGMVRCQCGSAMTLRRYVRGGVERSASRLICENQASCGTASCTVAEFTESVIQAMEATIADFDLKLSQPQQSSTALHTQMILRLEKRLEDLDKQELSLWEKYTQESMPRHIFETLRQKIISDRTASESELQAARASSHPEIDYNQKRETFSTALTTLQDPEAPVKQQNKLLRQCIEVVIYNRKAKESKSRRFGTPEPMELDFHFKV